MHIQKSSFFGDDSELSLFANIPLSQAQMKCQELMKQLSQHRSTIRQLKQDNEWLQITNAGLQNQCNTIKEMLQQKKSMIVEINCDLRMANQQINRLEDVIALKNEQIIKLEQQANKKQKQLNQTNHYISKVQIELSSAKLQIQSILKQKQPQKIKLEAEFDRKYNIFIHNIQSKISNILQKCDTSNQMLSVHKKLSPNTTPNANTFQQILNELTSKIQKLIQRQNNSSKNNNQIMRIYQQKTRQSQQNIQTLQIQLKQTNKLLDQSQSQYMLKTKRVGELQSNIQIMQKQSNKISEQMQYHQLLIYKMINIFIPLMPYQGAELKRVEEAIKNNKSHYQIELTLQEIKPVIRAITDQRQQGFTYKRQMKEWENKIKMIQEEYDTLKLKHMTLQRQYEAVIDDNRRILKFNQLSRYRTQRNTKSINKENNMSCANSNIKAEVIKK